MSNDFNPTGWVTTSEAAELTGYARAYFRQLIQRGRLHHVQKRGRDWWIDKASVEAYVDEMKRLRPAKHNPWRTGARQSDGGAK